MFAYVVFTLSFAGPTGPVLSRSGRSSVLMIPSKCIPGLEAPPALDGTMVGDVGARSTPARAPTPHLRHRTHIPSEPSPLDLGFDFLRISTTIVQLNGDLKYVREAEILHGRVAMLAAAGFVAPELFRFRTEWSPRALEAQFQVPVEVWGQIAFAIAIAEGLRSQFIFKPDMVPGEHG